MRKFEGLSDFFRNATDEEKREVYLEVIDKANEEQLKTIEKAREIRESDKESIRETNEHVIERSE